MNPLDVLQKQPKPMFNLPLALRVGVPVGLAGLALAVGQAQEKAESVPWRTVRGRLQERHGGQLSPDQEKKGREFYNVLKRFAPSMAADPVVSESWVAKNLTFGELAPAEVSDLVAAEEKFRKIQPKSRGLLSAATDVAKLVF